MRPSGLNVNEYEYGRASPRFAYELALLSEKGSVLLDAQYEDHVRRVIGEAVERKALLPRVVER